MMFIELYMYTAVLVSLAIGIKKTDTFADYKTAASQFSDYNPESDTVFVGMSLDPGAAERQTQRSANISSAKGASDSNYNAIPKMYKTKNEEGKTVYVSLSKHSKYSQGGIMQSKKYRAGGQNPPQTKPTYIFECAVRSDVYSTAA